LKNAPSTTPDLPASNVTGSNPGGTSIVSPQSQLNKDTVKSKSTSKKPPGPITSKPNVTKKVPTKKANPDVQPAVDPPWKMVNRTGMQFALIPAGEFLMGADPNDPKSAGKETGETPQHLVRITQPFFLGIFEVTRADFAAVTGSKERGLFRSSDKLPVESVSWFDAIDFCNALSQMENNLPPYYQVEGGGSNRTVTIPNPKGIGYRLPTEAEWEYACRANGPPPFIQTPYSFGANEDDLGLFAWFSANSDNQAHPVGSGFPNLFHLHDMHGNVWEWCWDWHNLRYYENSPTNDPIGSHSGTHKVRRGGSYDSDAVYSRSAFRAWYAPEKVHPNIGFRVAKTKL
jgi:formylglycine-generating enzyme required for sulfatase activity